MQSLAFWKNNDKLDSRYIEPPSHQLTPSETQLAASDDENLPPLPPDINRTSDKFESEVTKSYQQLAQQTKESEQRFVDSLADVEKQTRTSLNQLPSRSSYASSSTDPQPNFNNPLTPKPVNRSQPNTQVAQTSIEAMPPSNGSFRPRPSTTPSMPASPTTHNPGMTEYEKMAQHDAEPFKPSNPPAIASASKNSTLPKINYPTSNSPLKPNNQLAADSNSVSNPYSTGPKSDLSLQPIAKARQSSSTQAGGDSQQVNYEYPTTPYEPYRSSSQNSNQQQFASVNSQQNTSPLKPSIGTAANNSATGKPIAGGMNLDIAGQGSYAPGSIRRPKALNPNELKLPTSAQSSSTADSSNQPGGSFKR